MRGISLGLLLWAGCNAAPNVCAPFSGQSCVAVQVRGLVGTALDQLHVQSAALQIDTLDPDPRRRPPAETPLAFALLPGAGNSGDPFDLTVSGLIDGIELGRGAISSSVPPGKHTTAVVELGPIVGLDLAGVDLTQSVAGDLASRLGIDMSGSAVADLSAVDLSCAATPDEDGDGIGDSCDPCPIDVGALDSDSDGVADACDPDPQKPGNKILMFDGFDVDDTNRWSAGTLAGGSRHSNSSGEAFITDLEDVLPTSFRVETRMLLQGAGAEMAAGFFVADQAGPIGTGIKCMMRHSMASGTDTVDADLFMNGAATDIGQQLCRFSTTDSTLLRLTRRGDAWLCEATVGSDITCALSQTLATATPHLQLEGSDIIVAFEYVILESAVP